MCLQFGFVIFWQKDFGTKAAHKMLVKLTPGGRNWQLLDPTLALTHEVVKPALYISYLVFTITWGFCEEQNVTAF
jgi:hypothetical protein